MLHTLTDGGHMAWTCPCGDERMAHVSHEGVAHPTHDEVESVVEGTFTDAQGRAWTRHLMRPTGRTPVLDPRCIALPPCDCGKRTFLFVPSEQEWQDVLLAHANGQETSRDALARTRQLATQMKAAGKGPQ